VNVAGSVEVFGCGKEGYAFGRSGVRDAVVAIRKTDFVDVVARLGEVYRSKSFEVTVERASLGCAAPTLGYRRTKSSTKL
jgi:hypothetical protein